MMHWLPVLFRGLLLAVLLTQSVTGASYRLQDGSLLTGEPISYNERGLVVKQPGDTFSRRVGWTNFSEAALRELAKLPQAEEFVTPLLPEEMVEEDEEIVEITPRSVDRIARLEPDAGLGAFFSSPLSITLFVIVYLANIYAGIAIAIFRKVPRLIGGGAAALLPFLAPVILICLPTQTPSFEPAAQVAQEEEPVYEEEVPVAEIADEQLAPLAVKASPQRPPPTVYKRGPTSFNRRFFETKFAGFLRVVPGEAEKDMEIFIQSTRGDYVGSRIARVQPTELFLQIDKGGASAEVNIPYTEIREVHVRHKEEGQPS